MSPNPSDSAKFLAQTPREEFVGPHETNSWIFVGQWLLLRLSERNFAESDGF